MWNSSRGSRWSLLGYASVLLGLVLGAACTPRTRSDEALQLPPPPPGLRPVAYWERLFLENWNTEHTQSFLPMSTSQDGWALYGLAYGIDGNTAMFRATGKLEYLDRALLYVTSVVNTARDSWSLPKSQFKDSYRGWASQDQDTLGQEVALSESYCWRYVTRLLRVIRETPELYYGKYRSQYLRLLEFSEKDIFEKWFERGADNYIYRANTHMASHWASIAMDLALMTSDPARKARYLEVFEHINRELPNYPSSLREQIIPTPGSPATVFWNSNWGSRSRPGQDVAHGNGVVAFIIEAHDANMEWTDKDVRALIETLDTVIWPSPGHYAEYVDGSGEGDGWFNDGFMKLGRYDVVLQRRLESHPVGNNTQFYGNAALNVRLLSEAVASP